MRNKKNADNLKESLGKFLNNWNEVSKFWSTYGNDLDVSSDPFNGSFDEIEVGEWVEDMCDCIDSEQKEIAVFETLREKIADNYIQKMNQDALEGDNSLLYELLMGHGLKPISELTDREVENEARELGII
jgi:hypothetical protein